MMLFMEQDSEEEGALSNDWDPDPKDSEDKKERDVL